MSTHHVWCYAHRLNLTVGHGLKDFGQKVGHVKPFTPNGLPQPIPCLDVNDGEDPIEYGSELDEEIELGLPDEPNGLNDDEDYEQQETDEAGDEQEADLVVVAL